MSRIRVDDFLGIAPKRAPHLLDNSHAQIAQDCVLWSEGLRPIDGPVLQEVASKDTGEIQTIRRYQDSWLCWHEDVNAVRGPISGDELDRLYFTGTDKPRVTTAEIWNDGTSPGTSAPPYSYILGLPAPETAPVVTATGAGDITGSAAYVFTYVRKYSDDTIEESAPSPPSDVFAAAAQALHATMPEDAITFADYGITHKRLYRETDGTNYFFVTEVALGVAGADDNSPSADLGDACESVLYLPPPDGMIGLIALPNRCLAGFKDNLVLISEPGRPHAYPLLNRYTMADAVVAIGNVGTTIVVATVNKTEFLRGVDPAAYGSSKSPGPMPCISKRSLVSGDFGVLWSTPRGIAISDGAGVSTATGEFLTKKEWSAQFAPDTIHAIVHDGRYYGWFSTGLDSSGNKEGGGFVLDRSERAFLTTLGSYVEAAYAEPEADDAFFSAKDEDEVNKIYQFNDAPETPLTFQWRSKQYLGEGIENFAFGQVIADYFSGLTPEEIAELNAEIAAIMAHNAAIDDDEGYINGTEINGASGFVFSEINGDSQTQYLPADEIPGIVSFRYWGDGVLRLTKVLASSDPFPMPMGFEAQSHEFELSAQIRVEKVKMASSMEELAGG